MKVRGIFLFLILLLLVFQGGIASASIVAGPSAFTCTTPQAQLNTLNVASVRMGNATIYAGYYLDAANRSPNPIIVRFDNGTRTWCRTDYERTSADNRAYGLSWNNQGLYAVFNVGGVSGDGNQDLRRFTSRGWLSSYGPGTAQVAVIARLDATTGDILNATFHSALLTNGNINDLTVTRIESTPNNTLVVRASASSFPREIDGTRMVCTGGRPYNYMIEFTRDLTQALGALSLGCTAKSPLPSTAQVPAAITKNTPADQSLHPGGQVSFQWLADPKAEWYRLYIINATSTTVLDEWYQASAICSTLCNLPPRPLPNGTYAWYVAGWGADGQGAWSNPYIFYMGQRPPGVIQRLAPVGLVENANAALNWLPVTEASWYRVYITSQNGRIVDRWYEGAQVCAGGQCRVPISELFLTNSTYTWWIMGWGEGGPGPWTPEGHSFQLSVPTPGAIVPLTPSANADGALINGGEVIFQWQPQPHASWYRVYIGLRGSLAMIHDQWYMGRLICDPNICQISVNLNPGEYNWFVNSWGAGGFGTWNQGVEFVVVP